MLNPQNLEDIYECLLTCNQVASMVQWLGFYPSKVEVGVRFTVVATNMIFFF